MPEAEERVKVVESLEELGDAYSKPDRESRAAERMIRNSVGGLVDRILSWSPGARESIFAVQVDSETTMNSIALSLGEKLLSRNIKILLPTSSLLDPNDLKDTASNDSQKVLFVDVDLDADRYRDDRVKTKALNSLWLKQTEKQLLPFPAVVFVKQSEEARPTGESPSDEGDLDGTHMLSRIGTLLSILALVDLTFYLQSTGASSLWDSTSFGWIWDFFENGFNSNLSYLLFNGFWAAINFLVLIPLGGILQWVFAIRASRKSLGTRKLGAVFFTGGAGAFFIAFFILGEYVPVPIPFNSGPIPMAIINASSWNNAVMLYGLIVLVAGGGLLCASAGYSAWSNSGSASRLALLVSLVGVFGSLVALACGIYLAYLHGPWYWSPNALYFPPNQTYLDIIAASLVASVLFEVLLIAAWVSSLRPSLRKIHSLFRS